MNINKKRLTFYSKDSIDKIIMYVDGTIEVISPSSMKLNKNQTRKLYDVLTEIYKETDEKLDKCK